MPFILLRLLIRSRKNPAYRERLLERFGYYPVALDRAVWVHAVSLGEAVVAIPIIQYLLKNYPEHSLVVTTTTLTGAQKIKSTFENQVIHLYLPYDLPGSMRRFFKKINPIAGIIIETELWPNLLATCQERHIPILLANARLSEKSARGYARFRSITKNMFNAITLLAAQYQEDGERFLKLGFNKNNLHVTGNIKFDLSLPADLPQAVKQLRGILGENRFIWIAASTHAGEEEIILNAHTMIRKAIPTALLLLVPRHPERFEEVYALVKNKEFESVRYTDQHVCTDSTAVFLGDVMGKMLLFYGACDIAFIGGSLIPVGGHNMLEAAMLGKPILTGPHVFNFSKISDLLSEKKALIKIDGATSLGDHVIRLQADTALRQEMSAQGYHVVENNRGALDKHVALIEQLIS